MKIKETLLKGCFLVTPSVFEDSRGYFYESYNQQILEEAIGYPIKFIQDNQSLSSAGIIRGLHLQLGDKAQTKLLRVITGSIVDVAVDVRPHSLTFGKHVSVLLSGENKNQLLIPKGFAHGFSVLEDKTLVQYKVDNFYAPEAEAGIIYNDLDLNIDWQLPQNKIITSAKDQKLPTLVKFNEKHG